MPPVQLKKDTLSIHILRVGDGDSIVIELPEQNGVREHGLVDAYLQGKTLNYVQDLGVHTFKLVVATHPHKDHILAIKHVLENFGGKVEQFWDSGFRHTSGIWDELMEYILTQRPETFFMRPTSGLSTIINGVDISVLAPSINLRNRYDTYGVDINNSSIVLKLTYAEKTVILAGDAQFESWGKITEEFPHFEKTKNPLQHIQVDEDHFPLNCYFLKVAHHGSKHGTVLEALEKLKPNVAAISCGQPSRWNFPHFLAAGALNELDTKILATGNGSIVFAIEADGTCSSHQYDDSRAGNPGPPMRIP